MKTGALIVLQREVALGEYERTGIPIDAKVSSQLLINISDRLRHLSADSEGCDRGAYGAGRFHRKAEAGVCKRNCALCGGLRRIGWNVPDSQGTMFVWAKIPKGYASSFDFCMQLVEKTGLLVTPGSAFGSAGEGYIRMALVVDLRDRGNS